MSLKRLGELKEILLGFDHEPDHVLRSVMKNGAQSQGDISSMNEPPEKLPKIVEPAVKPMLSLDEVESMLKNEHGLSQDVIEEEIFPAILQYKRGAYITKRFYLHTGGMLNIVILNFETYIFLEKC